MSAVSKGRGAATRARWALWSLLAVFVLGALGLGYVALAALVAAGICGLLLSGAELVRSRRRS